MKKVILFLLAVLLISSTVLAAGSWSVPTPSTNPSAPFRTVTFMWTGDSGNGTVPSYAIPAATLTFMKDYYIYFIETWPGGTAPTTLYDITIKDSHDYDVVGGALANRSATVAETAIPKLGTSSFAWPIDGSLTIAITNNTDASAIGYIKVYLAR